MEDYPSTHSTTATIRQSSDTVQGKVDPKVKHSQASKVMKSEDAILGLLD